MIKRKTIMVFFGLMLLVLSSCGYEMMMPRFEPFNVQTMSPSLTPHAPMKFLNNGAIAAVASSGNGTAGNPYIIEGYFIQCDGSSNGIDFLDTDAHVIVRDCWVNNTSGFHAAFGGSRTKNLVFENCTTTRLNCLGAFGFINSSNCIVANCSMMDRGFFISGCNNTLIENCSIVNGLMMIWNEINSNWVHNYNVTVRNVNFTNCQGAYYDDIGVNVTCIVNATHGLVMDDIHIVNCTSFVFMNTTSLTLSDWTQESNLDSFGASIVIGNCSDVLVDNANIFNENITIAVLNSQNVTIYNSDLMLEALDQNVTSSFFNATMVIWSCDNITIDKDFIECENYVTDLGLLALDCNNVTVTNTTFDSMNIPLLFSNVTGVEIHDNLFSDNTNGSLIVSSTYINFTHDKFDNCSMVLYYFDDAATGNVFGNNAYSDYDLNGSSYSEGDPLPNPYVVTTSDRNITDSTPFYSVFAPLDPPPVLPNAHFRLRLFLNPLNLNSGQPYRFIFNGYRGRPRCTFQWNFGDGTTNVTTRNARHAFTYAGTYVVTLTCTNIAGTSVFRMTVIVHGLVNLFPNATFVANVTSIIVGMSVAFTHTGGNGNAPTTYQWNFGDATPNATTENPVHQFTTAGSRTVRLTVRDIDGDTSVYVLPSSIVVSALPSTVVITINVLRLNITGDFIAGKWFKLYINGSLTTTMTFSAGIGSKRLVVIKDSYGTTMYSHLYAVITNETWIIPLDMYYLRVVNNRNDNLKMTFSRNSVSLSLTARANSERFILFYDGVTDIMVKAADGSILRDGTLMMTRDGTIIFNSDTPLIIPLAIGGEGLWIALAIAATITIIAIWLQSKKKKKPRRSGRGR